MNFHFSGSSARIAGPTETNGSHSRPSYSTESLEADSNLSVLKSISRALSAILFCKSEEDNLPYKSDDKERSLLLPAST